MTIPQYLQAVDKHLRSGRATEHTYRGDLQLLLSTLCKGVDVTNEPQRIACGAPDYILTREDIPAGYIEAKDVGVDLGSKSLKELDKRSALAWVLDQYKEKTPKDPTIREMFNTYRFADYKELVIDLLKRVTTVSVGTMTVVRGMESAKRTV